MSNMTNKILCMILTFAILMTGCNGKNAGSSENTVDFSDVSGKQTSANTTSGNTTSGNETIGNATSGNATSGNTTSENETSGNATSGNETLGNTTSGNMTDDTGKNTRDNTGKSENGSGKTYKIGLCNYVDDASLNQIVDSICTRFDEISAEKNVKIEIVYENCNADASVLSQIIVNFLNDGVDLMIGVATPVAMQMQAATEENGIPVVFSAVSDPVGTGIVEAFEKPGSNVTGTSDMFDTEAVINLIIAANPEVKHVGLLYDLGQDSSTAAINEAKKILSMKGIEVTERTGTTPSEMILAAQALAQDGVEAVFTPSDNTVMQAELSIYDIFSEAGIMHFGGADAFALNGAFVGYGVNYETLGRETANMAADILLEGKNPGDVPVMTFDNGIATVNSEICEQFGYDYETVKKSFEPYCSIVKKIQTAESFE